MFTQTIVSYLRHKNTMCITILTITLLFDLKSSIFRHLYIVTKWNYHYCLVKSQYIYNKVTLYMYKIYKLFKPKLKTITWAEESVKNEVYMHNGKIKLKVGKVHIIRIPIFSTI